MIRRKTPVFPKLNQPQLAAFLGIKRVRVSWATAEKIIERGADGYYHPEVVVPLWLEYERSIRARGGGHREFEQERARLYKVKADAAERKLAMLDRGLVGTADIIELTRTVALRIRNKMAAAIPKISRACYAAPSPKEATLAARREFDVLLGELVALKPDRRRSQFEVVHDENGDRRSAAG
jgi:hypothetical protein